METVRKGARLVFRDAAEAPCVVIETVETGPRVKLNDGHHPAMSLNTTTLSFRDEKGHVRLRLGVKENGEPYFEALDDVGKVVWSAPR